MKRICMPILILALFSFLFTPVSGIAGPFDQLKQLKIDPKAIMRPGTSTAEFQFSNFKLTENAGNESAIWNVDVKISKSIPANLYVVKTMYQNKKGETLLSGDDLPLPAGNDGKTFHLTRPFQKSPGLSRITFQIYNQAEARVAAAQTYPVSAYGFLDTQRETAFAKPAAPQRSPKTSDAKPDMELDVDLAVDRDKRELQIRNNSSFPVTINETSAKARFLAGVDQEITVDCKSKKIIQPGESVICYYHHVAYCPTLSSVDLEAKLNGNSYHTEVNFDTPIKRITKEPLVSLERLRRIPQYNDDLDWPGGMAKIIIRGLYVRIGSLVTVKALASLDSDRFPVVFSGVQEDDGIHAEITISGTKTSKPNKFCFNIMEITTCDDLRCGGVGVLLYRNEFVYHLHPDVNLFLHKNKCE